MKKAVRIFCVILTVLICISSGLTSFSAENNSDYILGDVDFDNKITIIDATHIQYHIASIKELESAQFYAADTDSNGEINILDATYIQKYLADLITQFEQNTFDDTIPFYWRSELLSKTQQINSTLKDCSDNSCSFFFYSDSHWNNNSQKSPLLLKYLNEHTAINKTNFGGDIVNDEGDIYTEEGLQTMSYLWEWREMVSDIPNHHSVVGNHDDGNATNNLFPDDYIYSYLLEPEEDESIVKGDDFYYYIDNESEKTRYLYLDSAYKGVDNAQREFIQNALLTTKDNWHIVVISHAWFTPDYDRYNERPVPLAGLTDNAKKIITLLDSYNSRFGIYENCKGWVEFCIGGHTHMDYDSKTETGIPIILVETDSYNIRSTLTSTLGTTTESSVNAIIADFDEHKVSVIRVGRGESREVSYEYEPVTYTNLLPLSLSANGENIYNEIGYKADTRWSQYYNTDITREGLYISGWIPCQAGDIVCLKNMDVIASSNTTYVLLSKEVGTFHFGATGYELLVEHEGTADENGNLVQFTMPSGDYSYMRIQCAGYNSTSSITIKKPCK